MPFGPGDSIRAAIDRLLAGGEGFVVFDDGDDREYVQFSLEPGGLMLMWPAGGPRVSSDDSAVTALLQAFGFGEGTTVKDLTVRSYVVEDDGIYAQFGRDADLIETFTTAAFEKIYGRFGLQKLNSRVDS